MTTFLKCALSVSFYFCSQTFARGNKWEIAQFDLEGTGCPQGSTSVMLVDSKGGDKFDFFQVIYDKFIVESGLGTTLEQNKKNCRIHMKIKISKGWELALTEVEYKGFVDLPENEVGVIRSMYKVNREVEAREKLRFKGPFSGDFTKQDRIAIFPDLEWTKCKRNVNLQINTAILLRGEQGYPGLMMLDSTSGLFSQKWKVSLRPCVEAPRIGL